MRMTPEYLWNYQVKDNYYCGHCLSESGGSRSVKADIGHSLFSCPQLTLFLSKVYNFLTYECKENINITEIEYILGYESKDNEGLNCFLLELKQFIFYNYLPHKNLNIQFKFFINRIRRLILKEKRYYSSQNKIDYFFGKWHNYSEIYMIYGPDPLFS